MAGEMYDLPEDVGAGSGLRIGWKSHEWRRQPVRHESIEIAIVNNGGNPTSLPKRFLCLMPMEMEMRVLYEGVVLVPPIGFPWSRSAEHEGLLELKPDETCTMTVPLEWNLGSKLPGRYTVEVGLRRSEPDGREGKTWWLSGAAVVVVERASEVQISEILRVWSEAPAWRKADLGRLREWGDLVDPRLLPMLGEMQAQLESEMAKDPEGPILFLDAVRFAIEKCKMWSQLERGHSREVQKYIEQSKPGGDARKLFKAMLKARMDAIQR